MTLPRLLPIKDAAAAIGRTKRWLVAQCRAGKVPFDLITDGRRYLVPADEFEAWVSSFRVVARGGVGSPENAERMAWLRGALARAERRMAKR